MFNITLTLRDSNNTGKANFEPTTIILNKDNPRQDFKITLSIGYQIDDFLYTGKSYKIIDNQDNTFSAILKENYELTTNEDWYVNFSIVEE